EGVTVNTNSTNRLAQNEIQNTRSRQMNLREIRFGIEIETVQRSRREVAYAIHSVVGGTVTHSANPACYDPWEVADLRGRTWKVMADASLTNVPRNLQAEVVSPVLGYDDLEQLQEVVRAIRR